MRLSLHHSFWGGEGNFDQPPPWMSVIWVRRYEVLPEPPAPLIELEEKDPARWPRVSLCLGGCVGVLEGIRVPGADLKETGDLLVALF